MNWWSGDKQPTGSTAPYSTPFSVWGVDTLVFVGIATDVAVESTARAASDLGYRTIVVADACTADSDKSHARSLDVLQKWFAETPTADALLNALGREDPAARSLRRTA
jgi:nicotinamidase-related amidase